MVVLLFANAFNTLDFSTFYQSKQFMWETTVSGSTAHPTNGNF